MNEQEKIKVILPNPEQNPDLTYSIYFTTENIFTHKIKTHVKHFRHYDDALNALNSLYIGKLV